MLQLLDNYCYHIPQHETINEELAELLDLLQDGITEEDLYLKIRTFIYKEIKVQELAVTRILSDLLTIRNQSQRAYQVLFFFTINNTLSFAQIAEEFNCSKQNIHAIMTRYAAQLPWLHNLLNIKASQDGKGGGRAKGNIRHFNTPSTIDIFEMTE